MGVKFTGKLPSGKHLERLRQSPQFNGKGFQNFSETPMMAEDASYWKMIKDFFRKNKNTVPAAALPSVKTDLKSIDSSFPVITWFGHSSYLLRLEGKTILVDPVFSGNAAPVSFMVKAFNGSDVYTADDMPEIDYLVITHDHYDHLDYKTVRKLRSKVKKVYCSLGISAHLEYWGYNGDIITELDWWESAAMNERMTIIAAPARHFSGRGIKRNQTLWSSFIIKTPSHSIYIGGDSGYDTHFKTIGEKYGPFDIALLEAGQYNPMWPLIHMSPEETVQAAVDLKAKVLMPVHWGKFTLAMHPWDEPIQRILAKAEDLNVQVTSPRIGEMVVIGKNYPDAKWWVNNTNKRE